MDLQGFSNRDKSIINANPEANPYELKELGLSEKGFNRLLEGATGEEASNGTSEQEGADKENLGEAEKPEIVKSYVEVHTPAKEVLPDNIVKVEVEHVGPKPLLQAENDSPIVTPLSVSACIVENLKTGRRVRMSVNAAKTLSQKEYKIVDYVN